MKKIKSKVTFINICRPTSALFFTFSAYITERTILAISLKCLISRSDTEATQASSKTEDEIRICEQQANRKGNRAACGQFISLKTEDEF